MQFKGIQTCVVLTNYNGYEKKFLEQNLDSFKRNLNDIQITKSLRIFVVDHGPSEKSLEILNEFRENIGSDVITILRVPYIEGAVEAFNFGIKTARKKYPACEYIISFDHDVCLGENFFEEIIKAAENSSVRTGMFASNQYMLSDHQKMNVHRSTGHYYTETGACLDRDFEDKPKNRGKEILCSCFSGGLLKTEMIDDIGGLPDESYFHYYNCPELGFRAQLKGWNVAYVPQAIMWHKKPKIRRDLVEITEVNRILNILRFFPKSKIQETLEKYKKEKRTSHAELLTTERKEEYIHRARSRKFEPFDVSEEIKLKIYDALVKSN